MKQSPWNKNETKSQQDNNSIDERTMDELLEAETIQCIKCSGIIWDQGFALKKVKSITGKEQYIQIPIIFCKLCGTPLNNTIPNRMFK